MYNHITLHQLLHYHHIYFHNSILFYSNTNLIYIENTNHLHKLHIDFDIINFDTLVQFTKGSSLCNQ